MNVYLEGKVAWAQANNASKTFDWARDYKGARWLTPEALTEEAAGQLSDISESDARLVVALITVLAIPASARVDPADWRRLFEELLKSRPTVDARYSVICEFDSDRWDDLRASRSAWGDTLFYPRARLAFHVLR